MDQIYKPVLELALSGSRTTFTTHRSCISIGREPTCDLAFPDCKPISRLHAQISYCDGQWQLMDLGSVNGTWLNGTRICPRKSYPLKEGDKISLAQTHTVIFLWGDTPILVQPAETASTPPVSETPPVITPPPAPSARPKVQFCRSCGYSVSGRFCPCCGAPQDIPPAFGSMPSAPPPAPSMAPTAPRPSMAPPPAPSMAPPPAPSMAPPSAPAAAQPQKKKSIFGSLFGSKAQKETPAPVDDVQFRAAAPAALTPGEYFTVKVMMYREDDYARADREQKTVADRIKTASSSIFQARHEEKFRIALQSPDIPMDTESGELIWNGKYASADLDVLLPEDYRGKQLRLTGRIYSGIAVITDLKLILQVNAPQQQEVQFEKCSLRTAFISYASQDRAKVVARIQGIQLSRPDMDLFFDAESLRRGEHWESRLYQEIDRRDIFYLFWSQNAAASQWVARELEYAITRKGASAVEPVPLEDPAICPPPKSLQDRHFNDWTLRYLDR